MAWNWWILKIWNWCTLMDIDAILILRLILTTLFVRQQTCSSKIFPSEPSMAWLLNFFTQHPNRFHLEIAQALLPHQMSFRGFGRTAGSSVWYPKMKGLFQVCSKCNEPSLCRQMTDWLVVSTPLKNISQLGLLFPIYIYIYVYGKIKNVPNHQPAEFGVKKILVSKCSFLSSKVSETLAHVHPFW